MGVRYLHQHRPRNASWGYNVKAKDVEAAIESHRFAVHNGDTATTFDCPACTDLASRLAAVLKPPKRKTRKLRKKRF